MLVFGIIQPYIVQLVVDRHYRRVADRVAALKRPADNVNLESDECSICLEIMGRHTSRITQCGHIFHQACLVAWLKDSTTCPICRDEICHNEPQGLFEGISEILAGSFVEQVQMQQQHLQQAQQLTTLMQIQQQMELPALNPAMIMLWQQQQQRQQEIAMRMVQDMQQLLARAANNV